MEENRRVILFALLVTLSCVRGDETAFYMNAFKAALIKDYGGRVELQNAERVDISRSKDLHLWVVDPEVIREGTTKIKKLIPKDLSAMTTRIEGYGNHKQERLSHMLMSFDVVDYQIISIFNKAIDHQTVYGKLVVCFKESQSSSSHETCFCSFMFSPPVDEFEKNNAYRTASNGHPFTENQIIQLTKNEPIEWKLDNLMRVFLQMKQGRESYFYLKPMIVEEKLLKDYYAWVWGS